MSEERNLHATAIQRSHNRPPELLEDEVETANAVTLVWDILDEVEEELEKDRPDSSRLQELSAQLWAALKAISLFCGAKAEIAIDKSMETLGEAGTKWAIRIAAGSIAAKQLPLERIAQGLADVAKGFGG